MDTLNGENYLIAKAKEAQEKDPFKAKSLILTAKTLYPLDFGVQYEAYELEKSCQNHSEAANIFTYLVLTFQANDGLTNEIKKLTEALRNSSTILNEEHKFYVKMFHYLNFEIQHKILLSPSTSSNNVEHLMILLKKFNPVALAHGPLIQRLIESLIQGPQFRDILPEALPLIFQKAPDLPAPLVNRILVISFEHYMSQMVTDDINSINDTWKRIFDNLDACGKILKWEVQFLRYNKNWSKEVYWQKLIEIVSSAPPRPSESKQILFCVIILFVLSLQQYIRAINSKSQVDSPSLVLLELKDQPFLPTTKRRKLDPQNEPEILVQQPKTSEIATCLKVAVKCWQLANANEIIQFEFSKLIRTVPPISEWTTSTFMLDLSLYLGRLDEVGAILSGNEKIEMSALEMNLRLLGLAVQQPNVNAQIYEYILPVLQNLPSGNTGKFMNYTSIQSGAGRQLVLLPLTRKAVLEYCVRIIMNSLKQKININPNSHDILGHLLVLSQLNWPHELAFVEQVFDIIRSRKSFTYLLFVNYIVNIEIIEEFLHLWSGDMKLDFGQPSPTSSSHIGQSRRISTRGADKGVKDDFKQMIRQQIGRSRDDIDQLIINFIQQEHAKLINCAVETIDLSNPL